ncbi:MAG: deoxyguanosinetriphosphate triphosphohydrolase [Omnitrophica bacterium GWA2_41_15]|nr:MAG: deoxyguanosinetriphosphate triphosphohydrolase [Omnitrophica bacterium GWA2_41_15]HAZ10066.1 deoxyguanosinetriphosphate triphosphohydrolase [Candidatus Omnitrophota bacterium]
MLTRKDIENRESDLLAPYAMHGKDTKGRKYLETEPKYRSVYQRDRDRIIHSTAFRKLEYKTQVFVNHEGDYYRTRLTHTMEVSQIARSIARVMSLNEDLVEAIALSHDIGHPPFGHAGEESLRMLMKDNGGFDHNLQGLRVVEELEQRYPDFPGLNLTWEVREGINKHITMFDMAKQLKEFEPGSSPTMETQVVDVADEIAYDNHDIDDGLTSGLIEEKGLLELKLWKDAARFVKKGRKVLPDKIRKHQIVRRLIDIQIEDLLHASEKNIKFNNIKNIADVRSHKKRLVTFSDSMQKKRKELRAFLMDNLYKNFRVIRMSDKARRFIIDLFKVYLEKPEQLPPSDHKKINKGNIHRVICDYIAGMTDRYALDEYKKLFDPYERV